MNVTDHRAELERHLAWFESKLPPRPAHFVGWLRKPSSRYVRLPLGVALIGGGVLSFLPVLGLWMLPLGMVLVAQDVPALEKPTARTLNWVERKWLERQRARGVDPTPFDPRPDAAADSSVKPAA
uniref:Transmembrane protein n=1 Tax=Rhodopseudomonas palustris (strain DX-1) TaxID=652103 RepID=E6VN24_RHOPX